MNTYASVNTAVNTHTISEFDVMAAFSRLDTTRKMALFDHLMAHRPHAYRNTLHAIWPQATEDDARKLETILRMRIRRLQNVA